MQQHSPSDQELEHSALVFCRLRTSESMAVGSREWRSIVAVNWEFQYWFQDVLDQVIAFYEPTSSGREDLVQVQATHRPPFSSPLIPDFFANLDPLIQSFTLGVGSAALWDGFKAGAKLLKKLISQRLEAQHLPPDAFVIGYSVTQLEQFCICYVHQHGHPRAKVTAHHEAYNTQYQGGYAFKIDSSEPMGWIITVEGYYGCWQFIADGSGMCFKLTVRESGRCFTKEQFHLLDE